MTAFALCAIAGAQAAEVRLFDGVTERVATDPVSGFAIFGFDPVAYFIEGKAQAGHPGLEWRTGSVTWRFASEGNRAAFIAHPEVYTPAYGGYDAESVERGAAVAPDPDIFLVDGERLFLFRSAEARDRFVAKGGVKRADARWKGLAAQLGN